MAGSSEAVTAGVLAAVSAVEGAVDAELQKLDQLDDDGLEQLRERRLQQMKRDAKQVWSRPSRYGLGPVGVCAPYVGGASSHQVPIAVLVSPPSARTGRPRVTGSTQSWQRRRSSLRCVRRVTKLSATSSARPPGGARL